MKKWNGAEVNLEIRNSGSRTENGKKEEYDFLKERHSPIRKT